LQKRDSAPPFNGMNLPQLIKKGEYRLVTDNLNGRVYQDIEQGRISPYVELKDAITSTPYRMTKNMNETLEIVNEGNEVPSIKTKNPNSIGNGAITIIPDDGATSVLAENYCDLIFVDSIIPQNYARLMLRKRSPFTKRLNDAITANEVHIQRIKRKYIEYRWGFEANESEVKVISS
jgi:hypothetical protein